MTIPTHETPENHESQPARKPGVRQLPPHLVRRSAARLGAVQLLFLYEQEGGHKPSPAEAVRELSLQILDNKAAGDAEESLDFEPDMKLLTAIVKGAEEERKTIEARIIPLLSHEWRVERMDPVLKAILRAAGYELMFTPETPFKVIINEYVDVAKAFFDAHETAFVNGFLDKLARDVREA
jgi:N utilization substance protein B